MIGFLFLFFFGSLLVLVCVFFPPCPRVCFFFLVFVCPMYERERPGLDECLPARLGRLTPTAGMGARAG